MIWFVIASAVLVSIGRLLAPQADSFRPLIEGFLSRQLDQTVEIGRVEASWPRLSPQISIQGLRIGAGAERAANVDRARLEFKLYNLLRPQHNTLELIVLGLDMRLIQDEQGRWRWRLDRGATLPERWERALSAGDLLVRNSSIEIVPRDFESFEWTVPEARLNRLADRIGVRLRAETTGGPESVVEARLELELDGSELSALRGYARTLAPTRVPGRVGTGPGLVFDADAEAWLEWNRSSGARLHALLGFEAGVPGEAAVERLAIDASWGDGEGMRAEVNSLPGQRAGSASAIVGLGLGFDGARLAVAAQRLDLGAIHELAAPWAGETSWWPRELGGTLTGLELGFVRGGGIRRAAGRIDALRLEMVEPAFGVSGLALDASVNGDALVLRPSGTPDLRLPALYPDSIGLARLAGSVKLRAGLVEIDALEIEHPEIVARIDGALHRLDASWFVDLVIDATRLASDTPRRWLPLRGLPPKTRNWLDEALLAVASASAVTTLHGHPLKWRRHVPNGAVNSEIEFTGLDLAYAPGWPAAEGISGWIEFSGERMRGRADAGTVAGVPLRADEIRIANTRNAEIELSVESADGTTGTGLSRLALALPLDAADRALSEMVWAGPVGARARIWLPVRRRDEWRLIGSIDFEGASVAWPATGLRLDALTGELPFSRDRLGPASMDARMAGQAVRADLDSRFYPRFSMSLSGRFPVNGLIPRTWREAQPVLFERLDGSAAIDVTLAQTGGDEPGFGMRVASDLVGLASGLPAPLAKSADEALALEFQLPLDEDAGRPVRFRLGDVVAGEWLRSGSYWQVGLDFGAERSSLPVAENFRIEGRVAALEPDAWARLLGGLGAGGDAADGEEFSGWLNLDVGDLRLAGGSLGPMQLALNREREFWRLNVSGERAEGWVRFSAGGAMERSLVADFDRIFWPRSENASDAQRAPPSTLDPGVVPALDVAVDDLRFGDLELGEFRLSSHQSAEGLEIEQVSARRDGLELVGSGAWIGTSGIPRSRMRLRVATDDLGRALTDSGFDIALQEGRAVVTLDGSWPGTPLDLSLERLDGAIDLVVSDGVIPEASPGAGRLLGLVSLNSIPRRLRLDFSDVFGEGLSFDRVAGSFALADGIASTDDLRIDAPAAEILMRGRTNLTERSYDQTLIVRPGVGSALPVIGALAGGPVGAAAGAALQQIFSRPLQGISEVRYSVTGTWSEPTIQPISVDTAAGDGG